jgi:polyhydroxyalkanoate synthase
VQAPRLAVVDPHCRLIPPRAVRPFLEAARNTDSTIIEYGGEVGVALQHVGMLVGREAHRTLWLTILGWLLGRCPSK